MPRVKNISAGRYYHRGTGHLSAGDTADVSEELAEYLCEERGGFALVEELEGATVDPDDVVDTLEEAEAADADGEGEWAGDAPPWEESDGDDGAVDSPPETGGLVGSFDPTEHTVDEVRDHVESINGSDIVAELEAIRAAETDGKDRTTALEAIDSRLDELED